MRGYHPPMNLVTRRILAANIKRMIEKSEMSVRGWALQNRLDVRQIDRITKQEFATTIDTLTEIAERIGCQPWQLLVPNMDLSDLPMLVMSQAERELYQKVRAVIDQKLR